MSHKHPNIAVMSSHVIPAVFVLAGIAMVIRGAMR